MARLSRGTLLGLCTAAVGAIYAAGYLSTEPLAQANVSAPRAESAASKASSAPHRSPTSTRTHSSGTTHVPSKAAVRYRDGTYTGAGANPYGTLTVSVRIAEGKIAEVKITSYAMHYPQAFIDPVLPDEVKAEQTWRIYIVSGATASSYNFAEAVYQALQKARV